MIDRLENIAKFCPEDVRLLGMDVGKKTIGLALADSAKGLATPLLTIRRTKFTKDIKELEIVIRDYDVGGYVIGYPLNMNGSEGPGCQSVRDFSHEFERQISEGLRPEGGLWVALYDERLSTASVESFVDESVDISRRYAKEKGITDKLAAQVILQSALDFMQLSATK
ncbi:MAG: Holliday junction resolvase RuvX [Alphaproteobacteria bacterium]|nr:Holliday junction resolvase RuvX [Alphaproteobacteria bacterium]